MIRSSYWSDWSDVTWHWRLE